MQQHMFSLSSSMLDLTLSLMSFLMGKCNILYFRNSYFIQSVTHRLLDLGNTTQAAYWFIKAWAPLWRHRCYCCSIVMSCIENNVAIWMDEKLNLLININGYDRTYSISTLHCNAPPPPPLKKLKQSKKKTTKKIRGLQRGIYAKAFGRPTLSYLNSCTEIYPPIYYAPVCFKKPIIYQIIFLLFACMINCCSVLSGYSCIMD